MCLVNSVLFINYLAVLLQTMGKNIIYRDKIKLSYGRRDGYRLALFGVFRKWKRRAKGFKKDAYVLYYAYQDPRMPETFLYRVMYTV
ncbi:MAG: hypothetical protein JL56_10845 [Desulfotomaculum sp. BICA1-6]|nr:MAG: hypothetical protein VR67_07010 [Peptococcaceae bacterium BRH_c8a]KJS73580.1 MAG: hypothetical protein JL56_10845 [Desulfotomaculum sp. BICA1-6]